MFYPHQEYNFEQTPEFSPAIFNDDLFCFVPTFIFDLTTLKFFFLVSTSFFDKNAAIFFIWPEGFSRLDLSANSPAGSNLALHRKKKVWSIPNYESSKKENMKGHNKIWQKPCQCKRIAIIAVQKNIILGIDT